MLGIDMFPSEKRSLRRFLAIYILSTLIFISVGLSIFYHYEIHQIYDHQNEMLKIKTDVIKSKLHELHSNLWGKLKYPVIKGIKSAVYDIDRNYLIGDFKPKNIEWSRDFWQYKDNIYHRTELYPYYIGAATIVTAAPIDYKPIYELKIKIAVAFFLSLLFAVFIAKWLGKLFLAPVHNTMELIDRFIKDTTHELNTPISTILTNIELFKSLHPEFEKSEELNRIEIASGRLSRIYDDLAYLQLKHKRHRNIESVNFSELLKERLTFFNTLASRKGIKIETAIIDGVILRIDREDASRLIDNLLSNAVKYTQPKGLVTVELFENGFIVKDNGIGMNEDEVIDSTKRFFRANKSEGGFGLGLNIVKEIVEFYNMKFEIASKKSLGTKVSILWER
ncbi:sensor histidine kinase [Hydrogenimonas thermophila]|uniref:histidine kinase n=1 Tax=Hydrogenimonas thermophila TaxID=223786 RepID=A0A1I5NAW8_9BACT|nr:HAMP domain-containing sensor histidine kinase [Hydrogenimonas thermophila]SFP18852.1 two-component system, OmpR family, sensor kinase [Hydrogenimonas thermophila]